MLSQKERAVFFVVEADRTQLALLQKKLREGHIRQNIGSVLPLENALIAFDPESKTIGKRCRSRSNQRAARMDTESPRRTARTAHRSDADA